LVIVASGPLTSPALSVELQRRCGQEHLYFYDAIAPIVTADSVDRAIVFPASRYDKGGDDYLNCPMNREEYHAFIDQVVAADKVPAREFERCVYFEGCMPIEEMARRGRETLAFGPMRPVGLVDPRTGRRPFAVVQLRQDDASASLYNMVGFQTKMTYPAQRRVFRTIPGLALAQFVRLGSLHRNTFLNSPQILRPTLQLRAEADVFLAGQLVGVEGYVESAATGLLAGLNAVRRHTKQPLLIPPPTTALGSLLTYVTDSARRSFQPMNANYGLFPETSGKERGRERRQEMAARALRDGDSWRRQHDLALRLTDTMPATDAASSLLSPL
jgi:methylenetetrahydrofolate--tRNA-(uracil-5-)-methyltransferase